MSTRTDRRDTSQPDTSASTAGIVTIHTDGACRGNPGGPGGWGVVLNYAGHERELKGGEAGTTNNRMELMAVIVALETLKRPCPVVLHSDSRYVIDGAHLWLPKWKRKGWTLGRGGKPVKNLDLWQRLDAAAARHSICWRWVKGHAGNPGNERADRLALAGLLEAAQAAPADRAPWEGHPPELPEHPQESAAGAFVVTRQWLDEYRTPRGAWKAAQLQALGVSWPPRAGWRTRVIGQPIPDHARQAFEVGALARA